MKKILITGATGNMGQETIRELLKINNENLEIIAGVRNIAKAKKELSKFAGVKFRKFDFMDNQSMEISLNGINQVLLIRPPAISQVKEYILPFIKMVKMNAVEQIVFLSLQGVEKNPIVPHYKIEKYIKEADIPYTFLRPSFFMQNLSTTHRLEIKENNEIFIPAGNGRTNFIDVRDIAEVAALVLTQKGHLNKGYELTGRRGYTYEEIANMLSVILGRKITYKNPSILEFFYRKRKEGMATAKIIVMIGLYTVSKLGKANHKTETLKQLIYREPRDFRTFAQDNKNIWSN
ncbi:MAG TPA: SDR family oxidoreductase [Clostridia bacterium]|nr:SDR family oxidoreductase [Clostridia bacterium]